MKKKLLTFIVLVLLFSINVVNVYAVEYNLALAVILFTILLVYREKGARKLWTDTHSHGGSSQASKTQSQKSLQKKNLTKTQKRKIRLLYVRVYVTQICGFLLLMVLPFLLGKVLEFLVMYLAFAVVRYILGFNYSLHYKKESTCITVGVIVSLLPTVKYKLVEDKLISVTATTFSSTSTSIVSLTPVTDFKVIVA